MRDISDDYGIKLATDICDAIDYALGESYLSGESIEFTYEQDGRKFVVKIL